jgi:ankyrin repeat protein
MVVFSSESFDEDHADKAVRYRAVRELLIKGAERDIRDN